MVKEKAQGVWKRVFKFLVLPLEKSKSEVSPGCPTAPRGQTPDMESARETRWVKQGEGCLFCGIQGLGLTTSHCTSGNYHPPLLSLAIGKSHRISPWCLLHGCHWKHGITIMQDFLYEDSQEKFHSGLKTTDIHPSLEQLYHLMIFACILANSLQNPDIYSGWILHL